jgi:hypothetical protein
LTEHIKDGTPKIRQDEVCLVCLQKPGDFEFTVYVDPFLHTDTISAVEDVDFVAQASALAGKVQRPSRFDRSIRRFLLASVPLAEH